MPKLIKYNRNGIRKANTEQPVPVGTITAFAGTSAPGGWLLCNGAEVSRTTYPALDSLIKETYGSYTNGSGAAGTTHLRVPDLRGRVPIGSGTGNSGSTSGGTGQILPLSTPMTNRTLGSSVGDESITLTSAQSGSPAHNHSVNQNNHGHSVSESHSHSIGYAIFNVLATGPSYALPDGGYPASYNMVSSSAGWSNNTATSGITVNNNNGETATSAHSNMQPVLVVSYIIKAL